ncbi:MAG TPA: hypothetical protein VHW23_08275 [Kofleriaceae bacterium]|jgi:hypothetical protein|nr:hypothetical protein [Kofleriaceae bacterium]
MKKVFAIAVSGLAALAVAASLGAWSPAMATTPATSSAALLTAWRCPITDQFFTSPITCKASCFGFTCQPVSQ